MITQCDTFLFFIQYYNNSTGKRNTANIALMIDLIEFSENISLAAGSDVGCSNREQNLGVQLKASHGALGKRRCWLRGVGSRERWTGVSAASTELADGLEVVV